MAGSPSSFRKGWNIYARKKHILKHAFLKLGNFAPPRSHLN